MSKPFTKRDEVMYREGIADALWVLNGLGLGEHLEEIHKRLHGIYQRGPKISIDRPPEINKILSS
jgi:hypothetical protein